MVITASRGVAYLPSGANPSILSIMGTTAPEEISLIELAERIGVSPRRIRYVVDQGIAGGVEGEGRRRVRTCHIVDAFAIGVASWLMEGGARRDSVLTFVRTMTKRYPIPGIDHTQAQTSQMAVLLGDQDTYYLDIGDNESVRFGRRSGDCNRRIKDGPWISLRSRKERHAYDHPRVLIRIDLQALRQRLGIEPPSAAQNGD